MKNNSKYFLLTSLLLIVVNQFVIQYGLYTKKQDARILNVAGRQRMLSQKLVIEVHQLLETHQHITVVESTLEEWKNGHFILLQGNVRLGIDSWIGSNLIHHQLQKIYPYIVKAEGYIKRYYMEADVSIDSLRYNQAQFLNAMERVVKDTEVHADNKLLKIAVLEFVLAAISIIILCLQFNYVLMPQYRELEDINAKLKKQNKVLDGIAWQESHELRRPLANILGICHLMQIDEEVTADTIKMYIHYLMIASNELDEIIREIVEKCNKNKY
ncbi:MAG: hypothetical protein EAZ08_05320 [Cytophagales bacterium]|nr:MAG: hypothetical protein EAZ08_05320 [Cytophagales bacterium]